MSVLTRNPTLIVPSNYARPMAPIAIQEAVQAWGKRAGRIAKLTWISPNESVWHDETRKWIEVKGGLACWSVQLSLRPNDPALKAWQEGRSKQASEPTESVLLIEWVGNRYEAMKLEDYGANGIVTFLEQGDTWSGRGLRNSLAEAFQQAKRQKQEGAAKVQEDKRNWTRDFMADIRRQFHKIPFHRVGIDFNGEQP